MKQTIRPFGGSVPRNPHFQMLRCLAASEVVFAHGMWAFGVVKGNTGWFSRASFLLGDTGVLSFFVLSGFLMTRQFSNGFGSWRNAVPFLFRRAVRIVPMYWIATLLEYRAARYANIPHLKQQTLLALVFLPDIYNKPMYYPLLQQGWTLNFEVFFYILFAFCLLIPRRTGLPLLATILLLLAWLNFTHAVGGSGPLATIANYYASVMLVPFVGGIGLALAEERILRKSTFRFPVAPALFILIPVLVLPWVTWPFWNGWYALLRCGIAIGIVWLCVLAKPTAEGAFQRISTSLGDASYSTYLFHSFWLGWLAEWSAGWLSGRNGPGTGLALCAAGVVFASLLGLLVHLVVERPLIRKLQRLPAGPAWFRSRLRRPNLGEEPVSESLLR
jgi:exopolysaccharide production protein ExoZ